MTLTVRAVAQSTITTGATITFGGVEYALDVLINSYNAVQLASVLLGDKLSHIGTGSHATVRKLLILAGLEDDLVETVSEYHQNIQKLKALGFDTDNMTTETFDELVACLDGGSDATK